MLKIKRAAIVPYIVTADGEILFLFGIDAPTGEITDFGGGVQKDEDFYTTSIRELNEETRGIFTEYINLNLQKFKRTAVFIENAYQKTAFLRFDQKWKRKASVSFKKAPVTDIDEVSNIIWVPEKNLSLLLTGSFEKYKMWDKNVNFYKKEYTARVSRELRSNGAWR